MSFFQVQKLVKADLFQIGCFRSAIRKQGTLRSQSGHSGRTINARSNRRRSASGGYQKRYAFGVRLTAWLCIKVLNKCIVLGLKQYL